MSSSTDAKLGKEVIGYTLSPSSSKSQSPSHAAIINLNQLNASSPIAHLRGTTPTPSSSSLSIGSCPESALILHTDLTRPLIHAHQYQVESSTSNCPLSARLHPPEVTPTLTLSPSGTLLAAGSTSGRIYIWYLPSGNLIASLDAHFRPVTCLEWTSCESGLVSAGQDARVLVWSVAALVDEDNTNPTPYAIFADHVQPVTAIRLSSAPGCAISSFLTSTRLLSASIDGTVKLWDVRSRTLIATWSFNGPVNHLAVEVGFRAFFVALRARQEVLENEVKNNGSKEDIDTGQECDEIRRVDLYGKNAEEPSIRSSTHIRAKGILIWRSNDSSVTITAMNLSLSGSHLLVGTSEAILYLFDIASSLLIRSASLVPAGNPAIGLQVSGLQSFLMQDPNAALLGTMHKSKSNTSRWTICEKLSRIKEEEPIFAMKLPKGRAVDIVKLLTPPSMDSTRSYSSLSNGALATSSNQLQEAQQKIVKLEADNQKLNELLMRSQKANESLWERVVKETTGTR